ncbi:MAG: hypothetical protein PHU23_01300 [Dehalococcoidales bacterium]|nr:hypothetical protein [Dehalococcoidales bacterium]
MVLHKLRVLIASLTISVLYPNVRSEESQWLEATAKGCVIESSVESIIPTKGCAIGFTVHKAGIAMMNIAIKAAIIFLISILTSLHFSFSFSHRRYNILHVS